MTKNTGQAGNRAAAIDGVLADAPEATDHEGVRKFAHRLAGHGLALLLVHPGSKLPADMRAARQRTADDKAAREAARAEGRYTGHRIKSPSGVYLATTDTAVLDGYLDRYVTVHGDDVAINLAVSLSPSRLVVVDADTPEQVAAFRADADAAGLHLGPPTVTTPGQRDARTGEMAHHGGGHWWFTVPEGVELPDRPGTWTAPGGYAVMWGGYVLMPPSVRAEGTYRTTGGVDDLPGWLTEQITMSGRDRIARAQRVRDQVSDGGGGSRDEKIAAFGAGLSWDDILTPHDWMATGTSDPTCGCPTYTAPGVHTSPKSATGHEFGCAGIYSESTDPPLMVWTTDPGEPFASHIRKRGKQTVTRLWAVALLNHDGDMGKAMTAYDLHDDSGLTLGDAEHQGDADDGAPVLPPEFWESRPVLRHIRDAAWSMLASPDATLAIVLATLSASVPPGVRVDTGVRRPMPMHTFAAPVGRTGGFKTSAMEAAEKAITFVPAWSQDVFSNDPPIMVPIGEDELVRRATIGTGQGIIENYMGDVLIAVPETATPRNGRPRTRRQQVRSNVLVVMDEGNGLTKALADANSIVGETLRELWSGVTTGQDNAKAENRRGVKRGTYSFGLIVGFQVSVLARMLGGEHVELGTPQRFLFAWTGAPDIPDEEVADPGVFDVRIPAEPIRLCAALLDRVRAILLPLLRRGGTDSETDSQRVSMLVRLAALLAVLDDRSEVSEDDWRLAENLADNSRAITEYALTAKRTRDTQARKVLRAQQVADAIAVHDATAASGAERAAARIETAIRTEGVGGVRAKWTGDKGIRQTKFKGDDRDDADAGLALLVTERKRARLVEQGRTTWVELLD